MKILDFSDPAARAELQTLADRTSDWMETPPAGTWPLAEVSADEPASAAVAKALREVRLGGDEALVSLQSKLSGKPTTTESVPVAADAIDQAHENASDAFLETLRATIEAMTRFHENSLPIPIATYRFHGSTIATTSHVIRRVGILVPARVQAGVSTLLAAAIPARVAGVEQIAVAVTPDETGEAPHEVLAAAKELGITAVYKLDPFAALAAFTFGTPTVPRVDLVAGHGDLAVFEARKHISDRLLANRISGPSDLAVFADDAASADWIAADLIAATENPPLLSAVVVTESRTLADAIAPALKAQAGRLPNGDDAIAVLEEHACVVIAEDPDDAIALIDDLAPQSLALLRADATDIVGRIHNAGAIFIGRYSPPSIGGVCAGAGHLQPGGGTARFSSGLSVEDFRKRTLQLHFTEAGYRTLSGTARAMAGVEGLPGHERSIEMRES